MFGLLALCTAKVQKCCCVCTYGTFALIFTVGYALVATAIITLNMISKDTITAFCDGSLSESALPSFMMTYIDSANVYIDGIDNTLG